MTVTPTFLTRASGLAAAAAGTVFIGVQINHPHLDVTTVTTTEMAVRGTFKVLMCALALVGITGLYASRPRRNGILGLVGYVVLAVGYLLVMGTSFVAAYVLPSIAGTDPSYTADVLAAATNGSPAGDIGAMATILKVQGAAYLGGGLLLGIALFRARVLARWATALLAGGGLVSAALSVMPDAFYRLLALPNGIAMIGLGISLWRTAGSAGGAQA